QFGEDLELGPQLTKWGHKVVARERNLASLSDANDADLEQLNGSKLAKWLRPYQRADAKFMATTNVINANQPRTGKTPTTISALLEANLEWGQHLIFAPKASLRNVWEAGIQDAYAKAGLEEPTILTGDNTQERVDAIKEAAQL